MGPWDALGKLVVGLWQTRKLEHWAKVVLSVGISLVGTFVGKCGWELAHGAALLVAVGWGMVYASAALNLLVATSPLLRGLAIAFFKPQLAEANGKLEVIDRSQEK